MLLAEEAAATKLDVVFPEWDEVDVEACPKGGESRTGKRETAKEQETSDDFLMRDRIAARW